MTTATAQLATAPAADAIRPFRVDIPETALADLRRRLAQTRLPERETVADQSQGVPLKTIQQLLCHWQTDYDWRKVEARLNALPQFITEIDGLDIHFIHIRSKHENALPLIVTHGWPGSVIEQLKIVEPLTDPTAHGGSASDAFHLVVPSMPGYGFSGKPATTGWGRTNSTRRRGPGRSGPIPSFSPKSFARASGRFGNNRSGNAGSLSRAATPPKKECAMSPIVKVLHTARTGTTGGREYGAARSSDGLLDIRLSTPAPYVSAPIRSSSLRPPGRPASKAPSQLRPANGRSSSRLAWPSRPKSICAWPTALASYRRASTSAYRV